jgi:hypothetical protein
MECSRAKKLAIDSLSGELDPERSAALAAHLAMCDECAREYGHGRALVDSMLSIPRPEPDEEEWNRWQEALDRRLETEIRLRAEFRPAKRFATILRLARPAAAAVIVGGIALAWWLSYRSPHTDRVTAVEQSSAPTPESVSSEARQYLDRSKLVLLGMRNFDPGVTSEYWPTFERESAISRRLVDESGPLKAKLAYFNEMRLYGIVDDLDVVLLGIANLESDYTPEDVELIRLSTDRKGLLFKINMESMLHTAENIVPASSESPM